LRLPCYLTREQKLAQVQDFGSIDGISDRDGWTIIQPDAHYDWFEQRDPGYAVLMPLAIKDAKGQVNPNAVFSLFSLGIATNRDAWVYNFDRNRLWERMQGMFAFYEERRQGVAAGILTNKTAHTNDAPSKIKWTAGLKQQLARNQELKPVRHSLRLGTYKPFTQQHLYYDRVCIERVYRTPAMFPTAHTPNQVIAVTGRGETVPFSALLADSVPNLHFISSGQCFSRWSYRKLNVDTWTDQAGSDAIFIDGYARTDNITDWCLRKFQDHYGDPSITKDDIWYYIYGVLHAPDYRKRFASDLAKDLPRIPFAPDFHAFKEAGEQLAELHLGYETCAPWQVEFRQTGDSPEVWKLTHPMRWLDKTKRESLQITPHVVMHDIPTEAHNYSVNGRTPLEWAIDRLRIRMDKASGIMNDPNAWFADHPAELGKHLARLIRVSVESAHLIQNLPPLLDEPVVMG
jgi:predicted helicase